MPIIQCDRWPLNRHEVIQTTIGDVRMLADMARDLRSNAGHVQTAERALTATTGTDPNAVTLATTQTITGAKTFSAVQRFSHIATSGTTPIITASTGAGTGPTVTITGDDTAGKITVVTGTAPAGSANIANITFGANYATAPKAIILTPANAAASALSGNQAAFSQASSWITTSWVLRAGSTALAASTTYVWSYLVIGG